ncbi:MAG: S8 family serine peptidase [Actinomycetota bacterium]
MKPTRLGAVVAAGAMVVGLGLPAGASAASSSLGRVPAARLASGLERLLASRHATVRSAQDSGSVKTAGYAQPAGTTGSSRPFGTIGSPDIYPDSCGDTPGVIDLSQAALGDDGSQIVVSFTTCQTWADSQLRFYVVEIDSVPGGAGGSVDYMMAMYYDPDLASLAGQVIQTPSDDSSTWVEGPIRAAWKGSDQRTATTRFPLSDIGGARAFIFVSAAKDELKNEDDLPDGGMNPRRYPGGGSDCPPFGYPGASYEQSEIVVRPAPGAEGRARESLSAFGAESVAPGPQGTLVVQLRPGLSVPEASRGFARIPGVAGAQPNYLYTHHSIPNDPFYSYQWNLPKIGAPDAWDLLPSGGSGVTLAVLDSGIDGTNSDLLGRVVAGYDVIHGQILAAGANSSGGDVHGTAVAGLAAARGNDGFGVAGTAWNVSMMPISVFDNGISTDTHVAAGIIWAVDHGARILNMSLGSCFPSDTLHNAIQYAAGKGVLMVASSGNEYLDGNPVEYPAAYPEVLSVGATTSSNVRAPYSSTGDWTDMTAPGGSGASQAEDLVSDAPGNAFVSVAGTSFSAPQVSGAGAVLWGADPVMSVSDLWALLVSSAGDLGAPGWDPEFGAGLLDLGRAARALAMTSRVAGADRVATAVAISASTFSSVTSVVLATSQNFPDALAGAPLATALGAPILLNPPDGGLDTRVGTEISRLGASRAVLLGGTAALSSQLGSDLQARGLTVERLAGGDRYDTARVIALRLGSPSNGTAVVALGENFPDALAASAPAAFAGDPVLLTARDAVPAATLQALSALAITQTVVAGGPAAVSDAAMSQLPSPQRRYGADRYATSVSLADYGLALGMSASSVVLSSGQNFPDAVAAGAACAATGRVLLLAAPLGLGDSPATRDWLAGHSGTTGNLLLLGGTAALSERTRVDAGVAIAPGSG